MMLGRMRSIVSHAAMLSVTASEAGRDDSIVPRHCSEAFVTHSHFDKQLFFWSVILSQTRQTVSIRALRAIETASLAPLTLPLGDSNLPEPPPPRPSKTAPMPNAPSSEMRMIGS